MGFQPVIVAGKMAVLLFSVHAVTDRNPLGLRHWAEIGLFRCGHAIRPSFVFFAWIRWKLELDKLARASLAFD
jgi:hypothetical protein